MLLVDRQKDGGKVNSEEAAVLIQERKMVAGQAEEVTAMLRF